MTGGYPCDCCGNCEDCGACTSNTAKRTAKVVIPSSSWTNGAGCSDCSGNLAGTYMVPCGDGSGVNGAELCVWSNEPGPTTTSCADGVCSLEVQFGRNSVGGFEFIDIRIAVSQFGDCSVIQSVLAKSDGTGNASASPSLPDTGSAFDCGGVWTLTTNTGITWTEQSSPFNDLCTLDSGSAITVELI